MNKIDCWSNAAYKVPLILAIAGLYCFIQIRTVDALELTGPITLSSVTVSGDVHVNSMTISTLTISNRLWFEGGNAIPGRIVQTIVSSSTFPGMSSSTTTWEAISGIAASITLLSTGNVVRLSLSGNLANDSSTTGYLTIFRDMTNLGTAGTGLSMTSKFSSKSKSVGITLLDFPGAGTHTYQVYLKSTEWLSNIYFPFASTGYLILEEVSE